MGCGGCGDVAACCQGCSTQYRLVLALGSVVAHEAVADALCVVAEPSARAVAARFVAVALHHVCAGRAFEQGAVGPSSTQIAHAPHLLFCVPVYRGIKKEIGRENE